MVTVKGSTMKVYKDGVFCGDSTVAWEPRGTTRSNHWLGKSSHIGDGYFDGTIAYLKMWIGDELTESDVLELYQKRCPSGKYSAGKSCQECEPGTYSRGAAVDACPECPDGEYSGAFAASCSPCPSGKYRSNVKGGYEYGSCTICESGKVSRASHSHVFTVHPDSTSNIDNIIFYAPRISTPRAPSTRALSVLLASTYLTTV